MCTFTYWFWLLWSPVIVLMMINSRYCHVRHLFLWKYKRDDTRQKKKKHAPTKITKCYSSIRLSDLSNWARMWLCGGELVDLSIFFKSIWHAFRRKFKPTKWMNMKIGLNASKQNAFFVVVVGTRLLFNCYLGYTWNPAINRLCVYFSFSISFDMICVREW